MGDAARDVSSTYLWANGVVMTFGDDGEQILELQGLRTPELAEAIRARSTPETEWIGWGEDGPAVWPRAEIVDGDYRRGGFERRG